MKYRSDFVTNSSSSSFVVIKKNLTEHQLNALKNHIKYAKCKKWTDQNYYEYDAGDQWSLTDETVDYIRFFTVVDNFDLEWFSKKLGIKNSDFIKSHD